MVSAKCYHDGNHDYYIVVYGAYNYKQALEEVGAGPRAAYVGWFDFDKTFWRVVCKDGKTCQWITDMDIRMHVNLIRRDLLIDFVNDHWEDRR